jgi:hypothetical protein
VARPGQRSGDQHRQYRFAGERFQHGSHGGRRLDRCKGVAERAQSEQHQPEADAHPAEVLGTAIRR